MTFLALVLALLILQFRGSDIPLQRDDWYFRLRDWLGGHLASPAARGLAAIALPALALYWLMDAIRPLLFGLVWIAAAAAVFLYSAGRGDFRGTVARYRDYCLRGDFQGAFLFLCQHQGGQQQGDAGGPPETSVELRRQAREQLLYRGYERWFPVLFYFLLLGPAGALVYRLCQLEQRESTIPAGSGPLHWLDWLPARLLALTFAVTGDFVRSRRALAGCLAEDWPAPELLHRVACAAALGPVEQELDSASEAPRAAAEAGELADLLSRSSVLWVGLAALVAVIL